MAEKDIDALIAKTEEKEYTLEEYEKEEVKNQERFFGDDVWGY